MLVTGPVEASAGDDLVAHGHDVLFEEVLGVDEEVGSCHAGGPGGGGELGEEGCDYVGAAEVGAVRSGFGLGAF